MSGYVFHCTPCGHPHAGDCPPRPAAPADKPWEVSIEVGSRWAPQHLDGPNWQLYSGHKGYEVVSIVTNGDIKLTVIQVVEWGSKLGPVFTLPPDWWNDDGHFHAQTGIRTRLVPWV